jgi:glucans biosynthesis protein
VKFVVEFDGGGLTALPEKAEPEAMIGSSRGEISRVFTEKVPGTERWRAVFDLEAEGEDPVELRLYLTAGREPLSETWLYQYRPAAGARS